MLAMTDTRSSSGTNTLREVIAGIVDPDAKFQDIKGVTWSRFEIQRRELAYRKADAILGILPVPSTSRATPT
jgi:hypothetical protein